MGSIWGIKRGCLAIRRGKWLKLTNNKKKTFETIAVFIIGYILVTVVKNSRRGKMWIA